MDIARSLLHRLEEQRVDPPDDRRLFVGVEDVARRLVLRARVAVALELFRAGLTLVDAVDRVLDLVPPADAGLHRLLEDDAQIVERLRVERVGAHHVDRDVVLTEDQVQPVQESLAAEIQGLNVVTGAFNLLRAATNG